MAFVPRSRTVTGIRSRRPDFKPGIRGDLGAALADPTALAAIAPQVPRPAAWLTAPHLSRMRGLYARDLALFEHLVTRALERDPRLAGIDRMVLPVREALTVLSAGGRAAQPRELAASLARLFEVDPPMLRADGEFGFTLPLWTGKLMGEAYGRRYSHLDVVTLGRFRKRASAAFYRFLLGRLAEVRARFETDAPAIRVTVDPHVLAEIVGMPTVHIPQLRRDYVRPALAEIAEIVRQFRIEDVEETRIGSGALAAMTFVVRPLPPTDLRAVRARKLDNDAVEQMASKADIPRYRISVSTMIKVGSVVPSRIVRSKKAEASLPSEIGDLYTCWLAALTEALDGLRLSPGVDTRTFRGRALLDAIERDGANATFYAFVLEEIATPDLVDVMRHSSRLRLEAHRSRRARVRAYEVERRNQTRRDLRAARAEGTAPSPKPRRRKAEPPAAPVEVAAPEVVEIVEALEPEQAPVAADGFDIAVALQSPEAKAEADKLW